LLTLAELKAAVILAALRERSEPYLSANGHGRAETPFQRKRPYSPQHLPEHFESKRHVIEPEKCVSQTAERAQGLGSR